MSNPVRLGLWGRHWEPSALLRCCRYGSRGVQERLGAVWRSRKESWTLSSPKTTQKTERRAPSWLKGFYFSSLLMLFVDERYVVAKAVRPKAWSSWGLFSTLGLSCLCLHEISSIESCSLSFFLLVGSLLPLLWAFLVLLIACDSEVELQFLLGSVIFCVLPKNLKGFLWFQLPLCPRRVCRLKTSFLFHSSEGENKEDCQSQIWVLQLSVPSFDHILFLRILSWGYGDIRLHPQSYFWKLWSAKSVAEKLVFCSSPLL